MATVINDRFDVCLICLQVIVHDDFSSLDYYYDEETANKKAEHIKQRISEVDGYIVYGNDLGFMGTGCDLCGIDLAGNRYRCSVLQ